MGDVVFSLALVVSAVGTVVLLIAAFRVGIGWGLAVLLLPFANIVFALKHWDRAKLGFLLQLGGVALAVVAAVAMVSCVGYFGQDPSGVEVVVTSPMDVAVGEVFRLDVEVTNQREKEPFGLTDIDLDEGYLESFTVVRTVPEHRSSMHVPIDNSRSFTFDRPVAPGETAVFTFELRAEQEGSFRGDVDVCEGARFLTKMVQTTVREAGGGPVEAE